MDEDNPKRTLAGGGSSASVPVSLLRTVTGVGSGVRSEGGHQARAGSGLTVRGRREGSEAVRRLYDDPGVTI